MKSAIAITCLVLFIIYQAVVINDQKNEIAIQLWALKESGADFVIQTGMLQNCEQHLSSCRNPTSY